MPKIEVLPHPDYAPEGVSFEVPEGVTICDALLEHGVEIEHACGKVGATPGQALPTNKPPRMAVR